MSEKSQAGCARPTGGPVGEPDIASILKFAQHHIEYIKILIEILMKRLNWGNIINQEFFRGVHFKEQEAGASETLSILGDEYASRAPYWEFIYHTPALLAFASPVARLVLRLFKPELQDRVGEARFSRTIGIAGTAALYVAVQSGSIWVMIPMVILWALASGYVFSKAHKGRSAREKRVLFAVGSVLAGVVVAPTLMFIYGISVPFLGQFQNIIGAILTGLLLNVLAHAGYNSLVGWARKEKERLERDFEEPGPVLSWLAKLPLATIGVTRRTRKTVRIAPAIHDLPEYHLEERIRDVWESGADFIHLDVVQRKFVPEAPSDRDMWSEIRLIEKVKKEGLRLRSGQPVPEFPALDVHLNVANPTGLLKSRQLKKYIVAGARRISVHVESVQEDEIGKMLLKLFQLRGESAQKGIDLEVGLALYPETPIEAAASHIHTGGIDHVHLIAIRPISAGKNLKYNVLAKVVALRIYAEALNPNLDITVEGGLDHYLANQAAQSGATTLVTSRAVFEQATDRDTVFGATVAQAVQALRHAAVQPLRKEGSIIQLKNIVEHVLQALESGRISGPYVSSLKRRYGRYLKDLKSHRRVSLPLYYHPLFPGAGQQFLLTVNQEWVSIELCLLDFIRDKIIRLPDREDKPDSQGIRLTDVLPAKEDARRRYPIKESLVWLGLSSDLTLQGPALRRERHLSEIPANEFRFGGDILVNPRSASSIILIDVVMRSRFRKDLQEMEKNSGIPIIALDEARAEHELLMEARKLYDKPTIIKAGLWMPDNIREDAESPPLKRYNEFTDGLVVVVRTPEDRRLGYVTMEWKQPILNVLGEDGQQGYLKTRILRERIVLREDQAQEEDQRWIGELMSTNARIDTADLEGADLYQLISEGRYDVS